MLTHLHISDLAIVDTADIEFAAGFTVLTGETGAGKSIVVDALQLVSGARAGVEVVRHGAQRADITATFDAAQLSPALQALLEEHSIEPGEELVLRRVVTAEGKSRAWLNAQPVAVQLLRQTGELLLDIHGQHEFQALTRSLAQRGLLDEFGGHGGVADAVAQAHLHCAGLARQLRERETAFAQRDARLELLRFHVQELTALTLTPGEPEQLLAESGRLANRGKLAEAARTALELLYEADDANAYGLASRALAQLRQAAGFDAQLAGCVPGIDEAVIRISEAARDLSAYLDGLDVDPARQNFVEQRLAAIEALSRKHRVPPSQLPQLLDTQAAELAALERGESDLAALRGQLQEACAQWLRAAHQLSARRASAAQLLTREVSARMQGLGMAGGRFTVALAVADPAVAQVSTGETSAGGLESVEFQVSANPGQPLRPLGKVASGGELSRLSLAVQVALATRTQRQDGAVRCMVFDEVDAGIGGAVAEIVGRELASLARSVQVLCVTHLPQVASQADQQLRVAKLMAAGTTLTQIRRLSAAERIEETARMLGGVAITDKAREHASEMLGARVRSTPARGKTSAPAKSAKVATAPAAAKPLKKMTSATSMKSASRPRKR